jgi:4-amino-4-deoxy-L-arabinose transferase-like glycosyltransferase
MKRKHWIFLILWLVITRALLLVTVISEPDRGRLVDSGGYIGLSTLLASEKNYLAEDKQDLNWPPGYPFFILTVSGFRTPNLRTVISAQMLINVCSVVAIFILGKLIFGEAVATLAALLFSLSPNALFWSTVVMTETLFGFILIISLYLLAKALKSRSNSLLFASGLSLGAAAMVRPIGLPLILIWALVLVIFMAREAGGRRVALQSLLMILGAAMLVVPWIVRNGIVRGEFVFSKVSGKTFFSFNMTEVIASIEGVERNEVTDLIGSAEDPLSRAAQIAIKYPGIFIKQQVIGITRAAFGIESGVWGKILGYGHEGRGSFGVISSFTQGGFQAGWEQLQELWNDSERRPHLLLGLFGMGFTTLLASFSLVGILNFTELDTLARLFLTILILSTAYLIIVPGAAGQARFRIPTEPLLAILGARGISLLTERIKNSIKIGMPIRV